MGEQKMKRGRWWALYGALATGMAYSALVLNSTPAFAAACDCEAAREFAEWYCTAGCATGWGSGGLGGFQCPVAGDHFVIFCNSCGSTAIPCG